MYPPPHLPSWVLLTSAVQGPLQVGHCHLPNKDETKNKSPPTGSLAATVQSSIGYTNNGGSFAMAQSVAMGGANVRMVGYAIVALAVGSGACLIVRGMSLQDV